MVKIETEITFNENQLKSIKIIRSDDIQSDNIKPSFNKILSTSKLNIQPSIKSSFIHRFQPEFVFATTEEYQCGVKDEDQHVELYDGSLGVAKDFVNSHQSPVGQIQWNDNLNENYKNPGNVSGIRWGSGTLISKDLFITAGHCFYNQPTGWDVPLSNNNESISSQEIAKNMHINFNHQFDPSGHLRQSTKFAILELLEYEYKYQDGLDYAIVKVDGNPGEAYGFTKLSSNVQVNDEICIIGHPSGDPKKINAGLATFIGDDRIGYNDIDTYSGSSGAGILHSPSGKLVGVHTNGGCGRAIGYNYGFEMSSLQKKSPTLESLI
jgi:V8-like Glu-specific endopeptidase